MNNLSKQANTSACRFEFSTSIGDILIVDDKMNLEDSLEYCESKNASLIELKTKGLIEEVSKLLINCLDHDVVQRSVSWWSVDPVATSCETSKNVKLNPNDLKWGQVLKEKRRVSLLPSSEQIFGCRDESDEESFICLKDSLKDSFENEIDFWKISTIIFAVLFLLMFLAFVFILCRMKCRKKSKNLMISEDISDENSFNDKLRSNPTTNLNNNFPRTSTCIESDFNRIIYENCVVISLKATNMPNNKPKRDPRQPTMTSYELKKVGESSSIYEIPKCCSKIEDIYQVPKSLLDDEYAVMSSFNTSSNGSTSKKDTTTCCGEEVYEKMSYKYF